jgi:hypothetical protein
MARSETAGRPAQGVVDLLLRERSEVDDDLPLFQQ